MILLIYVNYLLLYTGVKDVGLGYRFFHTQKPPHSQPHLSSLANAMFLIVEV